MENLRKYGEAPFKVVVVHGGPGAAGEMAPVARELSRSCGVLEPFQSGKTLLGQVEELKTTLEKEADLPVTLVGFSWGAWLGFILAADYPAFVSKLLLIGSGPFEQEYAAGIQETRLKRLSEAEKREAASLLEVLDNPAGEDRDAAFARLGELFSKADAYKPITGAGELETIETRGDIFHSVWPEGAELRRSGKLLALGKKIRCPVTAIHGDYDPHPAEGVQKPLSTILEDFRFILLEKCGHKPWIEAEARDAFYKILKQELFSPC